MLLKELSQRAALQANTLTPDGAGGYSESWMTFAIVWTKIEPAAASDVFGPDRLESRARHRITLQRRSDLSAGQRIIAGPRTFRVHGILDKGARARFVTLLCEELP